jgi:hypothetical protein
MKANVFGRGVIQAASQHLVYFQAAGHGRMLLACPRHKDLVAPARLDVQVS